jgi:hypothetical protein
MRPRGLARFQIAALALAVARLLGGWNANRMAGAKHIAGDVA